MTEKKKLTRYEEVDLDALEGMVKDLIGFLDDCREHYGDEPAFGEAEKSLKRALQQATNSISGDHILRRAHLRSKNNRKALENCHTAYCFCCKSTLEDICHRLKDFIRELDGDDTARCPKCGIDSLLPKGDKVVDELMARGVDEALGEMYNHWFWTGNEK